VGARLLIEDIEWDEDNLEHVERHGVRWEEAHEALAGEGRRVLKPTRRPAPVPRYFCYGRTRGGRYVTVVFEYHREDAKARPITAWPMTRKERDIYDREA
jgi:uncharacterized DUF497 family protein